MPKTNKQLLSKIIQLHRYTVLLLLITLIGLWLYFVPRMNTIDNNLLEDKTLRIDEEHKVKEEPIIIVEAPEIDKKKNFNEEIEDKQVVLDEILYFANGVNFDKIEISNILLTLKELDDENEDLIYRLKNIRGEIIEADREVLITRLDDMNRITRLIHEIKIYDGEIQVESKEKLTRYLNSTFLSKEQKLYIVNYLR